MTQLLRVAKQQPRSRRDGSRESMTKLPALLSFGFVMLSACGPSKAKLLAAEVNALQIENTQLRIAIGQANENIEEAADAIELAQSSLGESCRDLADAVSEITVPEKVEVP